MRDATLCRRVPAPIGAPFRDCLLPHDDAAAERISKLPIGETVEIVIRRGRSLPMHRLFFGILAHVAENSRFETPERLLVALKIRLGRYDLCQLPNGRAVPVPQSISFAVMDQEEFRKFFDESVRLICEEILGGYDQARLVHDVEKILGLPPIHDATASAASPAADRPAEHPSAAPPDPPIPGAAPPAATNPETPATGDHQPIMRKEQNTQVSDLGGPEHQKGPSRVRPASRSRVPVIAIVKPVGGKIDPEDTHQRLAAAVFDLKTVADCAEFRMVNRPALAVLPIDLREALELVISVRETELAEAEMVDG